MKHLKVNLTLLLLGLGLTGLQAQETVNTAGGNASGSNGSVSYSVGQVVYTTNTGATGSVIQGVQQPYEIFVVTGLKEAKEINLNCSAYPNPTTDYLRLNVDSENLKDLTYQLFDLNGKLLENKKLEGIQTNIVMSNLVPATYFLKVLRSNKEVKTFKIIKK